MHIYVGTVQGIMGWKVIIKLPHEVICAAICHVVCLVNNEEANIVSEVDVTVLEHVEEDVWCANNDAV